MLTHGSAIRPRDGDHFLRRTVSPERPSGQSKAVFDIGFGLRARREEGSRNRSRSLFSRPTAAQARFTGAGKTYNAKRHDHNGYTDTGRTGDVPRCDTDGRTRDVCETVRRGAGQATPQRARAHRQESVRRPRPAARPIPYPRRQRRATDRTQCRQYASSVAH